MQTYEGYLEGGRFYPIGQPVQIQGRRRVIVTVMDEETPTKKEPANAKAWRAFFDAVNECDEEVPQTFERVDGLKYVNWVR